MPTLTKSTTIGDVISTFIDVLKLEGKSKQSIKAYKSDLKKFCEFVGEDTEIEELTSELLDEYRDYLLAVVPAKNTLNRRISGVRSLLKFLTVGKLTQVRMEKFRTVPLKAKEAVYITEEEFNKVIETVDATINRHRAKLPDHNINTYYFIAAQVRNKLLFTLLYRTGLRISEALTIKLNEIDLQNRELLVHGKGGKLRYVPITKTIKEQMEYYLHVMDAVGLTSVWLFPALKDEDTPQTYGTIYKVFKQVVVEAGITRKLSIHALRHGFASQALQGGMDYKTLQEILGHASPEITLNTYAHISSKHKKEVYDKIFNERAH